MSEAVKQEVNTLTEKSAKVLEETKANGGVVTAAQIAEIDPALFDKGAKSVTPIFTQLVRKGLVHKPSKVDAEVLDKEGNKVTRAYQGYQITDEGMAFVYEVK